MLGHPATGRSGRGTRPCASPGTPAAQARQLPADDPGPGHEGQDELPDEQLEAVGPATLGLKQEGVRGEHAGQQVQPAQHRRGSLGTPSGGPKRSWARVLRLAWGGTGRRGEAEPPRERAGNGSLVVVAMGSVGSGARGRPQHPPTQQRRTGRSLHDRGAAARTATRASRRPHPRMSPVRRSGPVRRRVAQRLRASTETLRTPNCSLARRACSDRKV